MSVKNKVKNRLNNIREFYVPYDKDVKLRYLLKPGFRKESKAETQAFRQYIRDINARSKKERPLIVFICQVPALWNGVRSIYEAAEKNPDVDVLCLSLPEKIMGENYDVTWEKYGKDEAYDFLKQQGCNVLHAQTEDGWLDLRSLSPDYVFLPRPYDIHLPECYRSYEICKYTKICCVPYGANSCHWDIKMSFEFNFIKNVYMGFLDNHYYYEQMKKICSFLGWNDCKKMFDFGYPTYDHYKTDCRRNTDIKRVLWTPRWTIDANREASSFFNFWETLKAYFEEHTDIDFVCRPHPLMFRNFLSCHLITEEEIDDFKKAFEENDNFILDEGGDYEKTLMEADLYIADYSGLLVEEAYIGKPIIYGGSIRHFTSFSKKLNRGMYNVEKPEELIKVLNQLLSGNDPKYEDRMAAVKMLKQNGDSNIGEEIVAEIVKDYRNC